MSKESPREFFSTLEQIGGNGRYGNDQGIFIRLLSSYSKLSYIVFSSKINESLTFKESCE